MEENETNQKPEEFHNDAEEVENSIEEEQDVELMEFVLDKDEIDEFILKLQLLKEEKGSVSFEVDEGNEFLIHYEKEADEGEE